MEYITTVEAAELWGVKIRRVQELCDNGKFEGGKLVLGTFKEFIFASLT